MIERDERLVQKVTEWGTGFADAMREPILTIKTMEGGEYVFQMPAATAEALAQGLLIEVARLKPSGASH